MELRELDWFITLADTEHVTVAAARLHISQPTLSRALARIERALGVRLFDRHQNRLRLNKYGEIFLAHVVRAMNEIAQAEERIGTLVDPDRGVISLGFLHSFGGWLVPDLLTRYRSLAPSTSFELHGGAADSVVDDVRSGRLDIGFVAPRPAADDLVWIPLGREDLCVALPPGHRFSGRESISVLELAAEPLVALRPGYGVRQVADRIFRDAGILPRVEVEVTELSTLRALVSAGMGLGILPASRGGEQALATVRIADADAFRDYGAIARPFGPSGQAGLRFLHFLTALATGPVERS